MLPAESHWWGDAVRDHFDLDGIAEDMVNPGPSASIPDRRLAAGPSATPSMSADSEAAIDLTKLLQNLGFGPDVLDWMISRLSTGERQRLSLARMLAKHPRALLLDEATANLDPPNRTLVEALIEDYRTGRDAPVLWVSHDPEQRLRLSGRRLVIHDGRLEPEQ